MKKSDVVKFFISMFLGIVLIALVAFNGLLIWVANAPRSLAQFTPMIEKTLSDADNGFKLKIGEAWLLWGGWDHPLDIRIKDVTLLTNEGVAFSSFPEISVGLDVLSLAFGHLYPTSLSINKPIISLKQDAEKMLRFGSVQTNEEAKDSTSPIAVLLESLVNPNSKSSLRKLRRIELLGADVSIGNEQKGVVIKMPNVNFVLHKQDRENISGVLGSVVYYNDLQSPVNGKFGYNKRNKRLEGTLEFGKVQIAQFASLLFADSPAAYADFTSSGSLAFATDSEGKIDSLRFNLVGGQGKITAPQLAKPLAINKLSLKGTAKNGLTMLMIENMSADFSGSAMVAKGTVTKGEKGVGIIGDASISNVNTDQVPGFWPPSLAPLTREWVTTNISDGGITSASVKVNIKPGDLALPLLPKEAIDANIQLKDAKIRYLDGHPAVTNVNANIHVDGMALDAKVSHANGFSSTRMSDGRVLIEDLNPDNPLLQVSLKADAAASDIATLLSLPKLEHAKHLNVISSKTTGRANGEATLGFYFFAKDPAGNEMPITFDIKAQMTNVSAPGFLHRFDIENATGNLAINNDHIIFNGIAGVSGSQIMQGDITYLFTPKEGVDTTIKASGTTTQDSLKRLGYSLPTTITGTAGFTLDAVIGPDKEHYAITGDFTNAMLESPDINYRKDANIPATVALSVDKKAGNIDISSLDFKSDNARATGKVTIDASEQLSALDLSNVALGKTRLSTLSYNKNAGSHTVKIRGDTLDLSGFLEKEGGEFSFENFPAVDVDLQVKNIVLAHGETLSAAKATLMCSVQKCTRSEASGTFGDKKFSFSILPAGKGRNLNLYSENAGALLRGLGVTKAMYDGTITITGKYADSSNDSVLAGALDMRDFTLKDAPILAKLLTLASLTGFFDTLTGNGIAFKKLNAPFTLHDDVITLKDAKTYGSAIGMNADGTITFPKAALNFEGTIVPSYTLNSMAGNVPIIGDILTGGEGQGVFAARYSIKGNNENPDVSVNPLSILTPGFLRKIFD